jgi:pimeloyl-ACP methyl ester carboxylesterase
MRTHRIFKDGVGLAYEEAGVGEPAILLVHGWGSDRSAMKRILEWAQNSRRTVAVDLRGFGESDAPEQSYSIEAFSDDLAFMAAHLGLGKPIIVGHSMGGMIALDFASRLPEQTSAAVVLESMILAPQLLDGLRPILAGIRNEDFREVVARLMSYLCGPRFDPQERSRLVAVARSCHQHVLTSAMEGILAFDSEEVTREVKCPLLYVGTAEQYADLRRLRAICPQVVTGQLVGCGHYFPLEVPEQLCPMIARFIQLTAV